MRAHRCWLFGLTASLLVLPVASGAQSRDDRDIRCYSTETCGALKGRQLWIVESPVQICEGINTPPCQWLRPGSSILVEDVIDLGPTKGRYLRARNNGGAPGYVNLANAHVLTFRDPRPEIEAGKRKAAAEKARQEAQAAADAVELSKIPRSDLKKSCILAAAERLPRIPGIEIVKSRTADVPPDLLAKTEAGTFSTLVYIDARAAGQDVTYNFVCMRGLRTPSIVQRYER